MAVSMKQKLIGGFTGAALAASAAFTPVPAAAQEQTAAVPAAQGLPGKHVTLRVGPAYSLSAADGIASVLRDKGCPVTVTTEGGFPKRLTVEVDGFKFRFDSVGSAGGAALDWCLDRS